MIKNIMKKRSGWLKGKRRIWAGAVAALLAVAGFSVFFFGKGTQNQAASAKVHSSVAEKGDISKTITGTGTLEDGEAQDVLAPVGVRVEKVLVESGDTVAEGQTLATLNEASIAEKLPEAEESLEDTQDEIDDLSDEAEDSSTSEYLKAKILKGKKKELKETEKKLKKLLESKEITAACDGVVSGVYVEADSAVSEDSEEEKNASDTEDLTAVSAMRTNAQLAAVSQEGM